MTDENKIEYKKLENFSKHRGGLETYMSGIMGEKFIKYREMWRKVTNREVVTDFPYFPLIETHYACNFKCRMCHKSDKDIFEETYYPEKLSMNLYRRLMDECEEYNCPSLSLNNNNEPLLDKHLLERLSMANKKGIMDIMMNTNAFLLKEDVTKALIDNGLTRLLISLDAASEKTYSLIRSRHYQKVIENIDNFLETRDKIGSVFPVLRLSFCVTSINEAEQEAFLDLWKDKADEVTFQRYTPPAKNENFLSLYPKSRREMKFACCQPFERVIITGNGEVYPCCYQSMKVSVGNIKQNSLYEIWHNDRFKEYRRVVIEEDWEANSCCSVCSKTR